MLTVLVADPHPTMAAAIGELLGRDPRIETLEPATDRASSARRLVRHRPDVLLLSPRILGPGGLASLPLLRQASPGTRVVLIGMDDASVWQPQIDRGLAAGFVSKRAPASAWREAVLGSANPALAQAP